MGHFALLDPDPATQINADPCGSGSTTLYPGMDSAYQQSKQLATHQTEILTFYVILKVFIYFFVQDRLFKVKFLIC